LALGRMVKGAVLTVAGVYMTVFFSPTPQQISGSGLFPPVLFALALTFYGALSVSGELIGFLQKRASYRAGRVLALLGVVAASVDLLFLLGRTQIVTHSI